MKRLEPGARTAAEVQHGLSGMEVQCGERHVAELFGVAVAVARVRLDADAQLRTIGVLVRDETAFGAQLLRCSARSGNEPAAAYVTWRWSGE